VRWLSRQWAWRLLDIYEQIGTIAYDPAVGRYKISITKTCTGGTTLDLGETDAFEPNGGAPKLTSDCEQVVEPVEGRGRSSRSRLTENVNQPPVIRPPQEGCAVSEAGRFVQGNSVGTSSYSLPAVQVAANQFVLDLLKRPVLLPVGRIRVRAAGHALLAVRTRWKASGNSS
jgi:hypothetical protein